jgi:hypothetical protein
MIPNFCALVQQAIDPEIASTCCIFQNITVEALTRHKPP